MPCFVSVLATLMIFARSEACYPGPLPLPTTPLPPAPCPLEEQTCVDVRETNVLAKKTVSAPLPLRCSKILLILNYKRLCPCVSKSRNVTSSFLI